MAEIFEGHLSLNQMMGSHGWQMYKKKLRERIDIHRLRLDSDDCSWEEVIKIRGIIAGINDAINFEYAVVAGNELLMERERLGETEAAS